MSVHSTHSGFSLIEALVYIAVLVLVTLAGVLTFISLDDVILRNTAEREVNEAATVALERIVREIRSSVSVDTGASTLGSSPGDLVLAQGATTTRIQASSTRLFLEVNSIDFGPLTSGAVTVDSFIATRYLNAETELVRVELTLTHVTPVVTVSRTYFTSAVLRGSYD